MTANIRGDHVLHLSPLACQLTVNGKMNAFIMRRNGAKNQLTWEESRAQTEAHSQDKQGLRSAVSVRKEMQTMTNQMLLYVFYSGKAEQ